MLSSLTHKSFRSGITSTSVTKRRVVVYSDPILLTVGPERGLCGIHSTQAETVHLQESSLEEGRVAQPVLSPHGAALRLPHSAHRRGIRRSCSVAIICLCFVSNSVRSPSLCCGLDVSLTPAAITVSCVSSLLAIPLKAARNSQQRKKPNRGSCFTVSLLMYVMYVCCAADTGRQLPCLRVTVLACLRCPLPLPSLPSISGGRFPISLFACLGGLQSTSILSMATLEFLTFTQLPNLSFNVRTVKTP